MWHRGMFYKILNIRNFMLSIFCGGFLWIHIRYVQVGHYALNQFNYNEVTQEILSPSYDINESQYNTTFSQEIYSFLDTNKFKPLQISNSHICERYEHEANMDHIYKKNIHTGMPVTSDTNDITLATHFDAKRFADFVKLAQHWDGPISVSVYGSHETLWEFSKLVSDTPGIYNRINVVYHTVLQREEFYPVNFLRNLAKDGVSTKYVYLTDIDLLPCLDCYDKLRNYAQSLQEKQVFVVPAFDFTRFRNFPPYPKNKKELLELWENAEVEIFYSQWPAGHSPTDFDKWKTEKTPYKIQYADCFEPYVIMKKEGSPKYDESFVGRIRDKVSYFFNLHMLNYYFYTLPDVFTIHQPHPKVIKVPYFKCGIVNYNAFKKRLTETINTKL